MFVHKADITKEQEQTDINMRFNNLYVIDCKNNFRVSTGSVAHLKKKELLKVYIPHMLAGYSLDKYTQLTGISKHDLIGGTKYFRH